MSSSEQNPKIIDKVKSFLFGTKDKENRINNSPLNSFRLANEFDSDEPPIILLLCRLCEERFSFFLFKKFFE
jgi:hypothetical protein